MKKTLLEKAKSAKCQGSPKYKITDEHIELAIAWMKDEIRFKQLNVALGKPVNSGNILYSVAIWLREAYRNGKININI